MSEYVSLYRKFRPQTFGAVIGQEPIVGTLKNQIASGAVGHAYLFSGSRGTGKTSCAKIFARAVNCLSPVEGSPCGKCAVCNLPESQNLDIVEIDAASNNRVEEVRDLRDKVKFPPINGKYKVYIIDEVHMLTDSAFNALLKTLEEPPAHIIFILATTEPHKLPATILSRCLRFDFRLVGDAELSALITKIYDECGVKYTPEAVARIARAGEGSVRDALSAADLCAGFSGASVTYEKVLEALGAGDLSKIAELAAAVTAGNAAGVFRGIGDLAEKGKGMGALVKDLVSYFRDLLVAVTCKDANALLRLPEESFKALKAVADAGSAKAFSQIVETLAAAEGEMRYSVNPRIVLESACIRALYAAERADEIEQLRREVEELKKNVI